MDEKTQDRLVEICSQSHEFNRNLAEVYLKRVRKANIVLNERQTKAAHHVARGIESAKDVYELELIAPSSELFHS